LYIASLSTESTIAISNNTFTDARQAIYILAERNSIVWLFDTITNGTPGPTTMNLTIEGNQSTYGGGDYRGIFLGVSGGSTINATINSNTLTGRNSSTGTAFHSTSYDTSSNIITNFYNNTFQNAYYGVHLDDNVTGDEADFGGGLLGSPGYNRFINCSTDIEINTSSEIKAENNWWGSATPSPTFDITGGGSIDYEPYLTSDPQ